MKNRNPTWRTPTVAIFLILGVAASGPGQVAESPPRTVRDPIVDAVLEVGPRTPAEILQAVLTLSNLRETEQAQAMLGRLTGAGLGEKELAALVSRFGSHVFLRLAADTELGPDGAAFADRALAAAAAAARDPARLARLVAQLRDEDGDVRSAARARLAEAKQDGVAYLLGVLADPERAADHRAVEGALASLGRLAAGPLAGSLDRADPAFKVRILQTLEQLDPPSAVPAALLIGPALLSEQASIRDSASRALKRQGGYLPNDRESEQFLLRWIDHYRRGRHLAATDHEGRVVLWNWNDKRRAATPVVMGARDAGALWAARLTKTLVGLRPDSEDYQQMHLLAALDAEQVRAAHEMGPGPPEAIDGAAALAAGPDGTLLVERALAGALDSGRTRAAIGAIDRLNRNLDQVDQPFNLVAGGSLRPTPLVRAATSGDAELRFAALQLLMAIDPREPYPQADRVAQALGLALAGAGLPRVLVAHPRSRDAARLASLVTAAGYRPVVTGGGWESIRAAIDGSPFDLLLVHTAIGEPGLREVVYQIRRHGPLASTPIGLMVDPGMVEPAHKLAREHPACVVLAPPPDVAAAEAALQRVANAGPARNIQLADRNARARAALGWIERLAARRAGPYDLTRLLPRVQAALQHDELRQQAARTLAQLGSAPAQRDLVDLASARTLPLVDRQALAGAFGQSVTRYGILLSSDQILRQYDRYNASETADPGTQNVLAAILDVLEERAGAPSAAARIGHP